MFFFSGAREEGPYLLGVLAAVVQNSQNFDLFALSG
jgi:hypothetical protein